MADVPDEPVARRVEGVVERDGQLDRAEGSARVAADARHRLENVLAYLVGDRLQLLGSQTAQVCGRVDLM